MADKNSYAPPTSPPPNYAKPTHQDAGPYPPQPVGSPAPGPYNQMNTYNNQTALQQPDPAYGGYYNTNQGPYGPPQQGYYGPGQPQGGYYGPQGPPPQGMYYQQQGPMYAQPAQGYYADDRRGGGASSGICAGIMGALACCCCLDILF